MKKRKERGGEVWSGGDEIENRKHHISKIKYREEDEV